MRKINKCICNFLFHCHLTLIVIIGDDIKQDDKKSQRIGGLVVTCHSINNRYLALLLHDIPTYRLPAFWYAR